MDSRLKEPLVLQTLGEILEILNLAQIKESRIHSSIQVTVKEEQSL